LIVIDASVFVKLFKTEDDSAAARALIDHVVVDEAPSLAPSIVLYETLSAALHIGHSFDKVGTLFEQLRTFGLVIREPTKDELMLAERIATTKAPTGGYPTLFDSIYHAMAIVRGATFITADERHMMKAGHFGSVALLADWPSA
jgi:predicted nucleic acid-binding protein